MNLYFDGNKGRRLIAEPNTYDEMNEEIDKFLNDHKFKSYYSRMWLENNPTELWIDVGSYTEFFVITNFSPDMYKMLSDHHLLNNKD